MLRRLASEAYGDVLGIDLKKWEDALSGGKADEKHPTDFPIDALVKGMGVEKEHTDDKDLALEIVMDHLSEREDYYDMLKKVEGGVEDAGEQSTTTPLTTQPNGLLNPEHPSAVPQNYPGISGSPEKKPERFDPPLSQKNNIS